MRLDSDIKKLMSSCYKTNNSSSEYFFEEENDPLLPGIYDDVALISLARVSRFDYASLSCLNTKFNSLIKSGYLNNLRKQLGIIEHSVYMVSDPRGWEGFDPTRKKWMKPLKIPFDE